MSIEYTPVDIACNLGCDYCYQEPMRDAGNIASKKADWDKVKAQLTKHNYQFVLFGGEPLLASWDHLEEVFAFGFEKFGGNGIQTNGTLITERHIDLFNRYRVGVGISVDGPDELNDLRKARVSDDTRILTNKTLDAIKALCLAGNIPSLIVTVHKVNGSVERRPKLLAWFKELEMMGVKHINLHPLEVEEGMDHLAMSPEETREAFRDIYNFSLTSSIHFQPFDDIRNLLLDDNRNTMCVWNACDPLTTAAVQGISRNGTLQNCGRANKDGVNWNKADEPSYKRYFILHHTPQEFGGCKDCKYFVFCKGNCPGTGLEGDWRNRTIHCETFYDLFTVIEKEIVMTCRMPITRDPRRMEQLLSNLINRDNLMINSEHGDQHGDQPHGDHHGDIVHGDVPHGDSNAKRVEVTWL